jgi:hypothetical protein
LYRLQGGFGGFLDLGTEIHFSWEYIISWFPPTHSVRVHSVRQRWEHGPYPQSHSGPVRGETAQQ